MKTYFLTFADQRLRPSADRIKKQAKSIESFDEIIVTNESNLDIEFRKKFSNYLVYGTKGYGWMCWKPQIILQTLEEMSEGDILTWADVDCHINPFGKERLFEYFDMVNSANTGVTGFQTILPTDPILKDNAIPINQLERKFTKGDLFDYFGVRDNSNITETEQMSTSICFFKKCKKSIDMVKEWAIIPHIDFSLQDDSSSKSPNLPGFRKHKHDQSAFSIICKLNNVSNISFYEAVYPIKFDEESHRIKVTHENLSKFPIWHKGDKEWCEIDIEGNYIRNNK